eukprot:762130-Hanusia_phi.AAC.1
MCQKPFKDSKHQVEARNHRGNILHEGERSVHENGVNQNLQDTHKAGRQGGTTDVSMAEPLQRPQQVFVDLGDTEHLGKDNDIEL